MFASVISVATIATQCVRYQLVIGTLPVDTYPDGSSP